MENNLKQHGNSPIPTKRNLLITGVSHNNIGETIANKLTKLEYFKVSTIDKYNQDFSESGWQQIFNDDTIIDTLILCHGFTRLDWIENQTTKSIEDMVGINLTSHMKLISEFTRKTMSKTYRKQIVVIGSMAASSVLNASSPYCAAKAGLQHFVKCVAWELAPKGFDVYIINPSNVADSPMADQTIVDLARYRKLTISEAEAYWSANHPRLNFLSKDEISELVYDLISGKFPYLSGTALNLTGGQR